METIIHVQVPLTTSTIVALKAAAEKETTKAAVEAAIEHFLLCKKIKKGG